MVVLGGHDQPCGALGVGAIDRGRVADSMGTYECMLAASDQPSLTDAAFAASLNSYCHVVPDQFVTLAYFPSGIMIKWFHGLLYGEGSGECAIAEGGDLSDVESLHYATLERNAPPGPTGLCITPNLIGTCNPDFNPHVRGIISGLGPNTTRSQIYKGILEGLACELSQMTDILASAVGEFRDVYVTGGGSRSALGLQLRAALSGRRLHVMQCPEAVCLGGAILAGVASGDYGSLREAVELVVRDVSVVSPDDVVAASYAQQAKQYRYLRSALTAIAGD
jgi:xylulokinase